MSLSFELQEREGKYSGWKVADPRYQDSERLKDFDEESARNLIAKIRKGLYFPVIQVWRDGRSISDQECSKEFADSIQTDIAYLAALLHESAIPESVLGEIRFLLACMHKDAPDECVQWITEQVNSSYIRNPQAVGFALGEVTEQWQEAARSKLVWHRSFEALRAFAYAIWRTPHFVDNFNFTELQSVLEGLSAMLGEIKLCPSRSGDSDMRTVHNWNRSTVEPLELLLGLLRTRASLDSDTKMILQPHQKITKVLANQVERVAETVARSNVPLFSRVQINIQKPKGDRRTPDLLYALRLYLTGDDGANAIQIASVSDSDND